MTDILDAPDDRDALFKNLILNSNLPDDPTFPGIQQSAPNFKTVTPKPGLCLKLKTNKGEKVFINICLDDNLPKPKDISDEELIELLESDDPSGFRIPMSIGEPHAEVDKSGSGCTCYDIVINSDFFKITQSRQLMMGFFATVVFEGLENKYNVSLDRNWKILKNKKFFGSLSEQNVRATSKPWIQEMNGNDDAIGKKLISEIDQPLKEVRKKKAPEPPFTIIREPTEGHPEFLVAEVHVPKVKSAVSLSLEVSEDRILLETRSNIYLLDIYLPYDVLPDETAAQYNRKTKILTITMPVTPKS